MRFCNEYTRNQSLVKTGECRKYVLRCYCTSRILVKFFGDVERYAYGDELSVF